MRNIWQVIKHEIVSTIGKPSFWLTTVVFPIFIFAISFGSQFLSQQIVEGEVELPWSGATETKPTGYVDELGLIQDFPQDISAHAWRSFTSVDAARAALRADEIDEYYVIPADFMEIGEVTLIQEQFSPFSALEGEVFRQVITYNLIPDPERAQYVQRPLAEVERHALEASPDGGEELTPEQKGAQAAVPYVVLFIFFFLLTSSSSLMLNSVSKEKENRVVEVLLLSLDPRELMTGKLLGLGVVALIQMVVWLGGGLLISRQQTPLLGNVAAIVSNLPTSFLIYALLYFLLGYLTYASLMGALGALAPKSKETGQFTFLVLLPLMLPLWLNAPLTQNPDSTLSVIFSLFPLTSPISMMTRMAAITVPLWQTVLSLGLLVLTSYGFLVLAARFFRADTLLSTLSLNWKRIRRVLTASPER